MRGPFLSGGDDGGEAPQPTGAARLDRAEGHVEPPGDLVLGESFEVGHLDGLPLVLRKRLERLPYVGGIGEAVDRVATVLAHQVGDRVDVDHDVPPGAQRVDGPTVRDREQPGGEPLGGVVARSAAPHVEEGALQDVLGLVGVDVPTQVGQHARSVRGVGVLERRLLTS